MKAYDFDICQSGTIEKNESISQYTKVHNKLDTYISDSTKDDNGIYTIISPYAHDLLVQYCLYADTHAIWIEIEDPIQISDNSKELEFVVSLA